jgi:hypothetical protein
LSIRNEEEKEKPICKKEAKALNIKIMFQAKQEPDKTSENHFISRKI